MSSSPGLVLGGAVVLSGCFPVETVELPTVVLVDNFEDGDEVAEESSKFTSWFPWWYVAGPTKQAHPVFKIGSPGLGSEAAAALSFVLEEFPLDDRPEAGLGVDTVDVQDWGGYRRVRFSARLEPGDPAPPPGTRLEIRIQCKEAFSKFPVDAVPVISYYDAVNDRVGVELTSGWTTHAVELADFEDPWWQGSAVESIDCLRHVDALHFVIIPDLLNLQVAAGTLWIDDVYLE